MQKHSRFASHVNTALNEIGNEPTVIGKWI